MTEQAELATLRAQLAEAQEKLADTGVIAACMRLNAKLTAQLALVAEALKLARDILCDVTSPRRLAGEVMNAIQRADEALTPDLAAMAAEWERGREAERLLDEGVKRRIWVQPSICGTGWQAWKQRPDGGSDWIANAGTPRDALRAAIAPAPEASA